MTQISLIVFAWIVVCFSSIFVSWGSLYGIKILYHSYVFIIKVGRIPDSFTAISSPEFTRIIILCSYFFWTIQRQINSKLNNCFPICYFSNTCKLKLQETLKRYYLSSSFNLKLFLIFLSLLCIFWISIYKTLKFKSSVS